MLLLGAAGCSTVETRRADPATLDTTTARSLTEVQTCLSDGFDRIHLLPTYRPTAGGGTYSLAYQGYVQWVIDIQDADNHRRIVVHAITSIWGQGQEAHRDGPGVRRMSAAGRQRHGSAAEVLA